MMKVNRMFPIQYFMVVGALLSLALSASPALAATADPFVGSYFSRSLSVDPNTSSVVSIHSDGTLAISLASMFCNLAVDPVCDSVTPGRGTWKKTGPNEVTVVVLQFRTLASPPGEYALSGIIIKYTWVQTFDDRQNGLFQSFEIPKVDFEIFSPVQNPLTDVPFLPGTFFPDLRGQRINVE